MKVRVKQNKKQSVVRSIIALTHSPSHLETLDDKTTHEVFRTCYKPFRRRIKEGLEYVYQAIIIGFEKETKTGLVYYAHTDFTFRVVTDDKSTWKRLTRDIPVLNSGELLPTELLNKSLVYLDNYIDDMYNI